MAGSARAEWGSAPLQWTRLRLRESTAMAMILGLTSAGDGNG
jgi:hypothetical protein